MTNLTDQPQTLNVAFTATGKLSLEGAQPQPVKLPPGARSTLFIPVRALDGYGDGEVTAQVTGLQLPGETFAAQQKSWKIGVRPAFPAQTVNTGAMLNLVSRGVHRRSTLMASLLPRYRDNCC